MEIKTELGDFKGSPVLSLKDGESLVLSFGVRKAHAIVGAFEDIKAFAASHPVEAKEKPLKRLKKSEMEELLKKLLQKQ